MKLRPTKQILVQCSEHLQSKIVKSKVANNIDRTNDKLRAPQVGCESKKAGNEAGLG
jgi:hypothetical protein